MSTRHHGQAYGYDAPEDAVAIEPELVLCDPHHHFWDENGMVPYSPEDLVADTGRGHRITQTMFVECDQGYREDGPPELRSVGETEYAARMADLTVALGGSPVSGIIAAVDLKLGDRLDEVVDIHEQAAAGRLRGFRLRAGYDPAQAHVVPGATAGKLADRAIRDGAARLGRRDLVLDITAFHPQLLEVADFAAAVPGTTVVVNHMGYPLGIGVYAERRAEADAVWRRGMTEVARHPNVRMKLGGFGMRQIGMGWQGRGAPVSSGEIVAAVSNRISFLIDLFGPGRCMFESNFPVDATAYGYVACWNAFKKMSRQYSADERSALLNGNAVETYRLPRLEN